MMDQAQETTEESAMATGEAVMQGSQQGSGEPFDSTDIREGLRNNVPPNMRQAYDKVVAAGMKIMFDKKTHHLLVDQMQGEEPIDDRLSEGVASLMAIMLKNSKGAFPDHLIIPAGIELMLHAADFSAQAAGERIDANTMASAIQKFILNLFGGAGIEPEKLMAGVDKIEGLAKGGGQPPAQQQPGAAPPEQPPQAAPAGTGGLLTQPQPGAM